MKYISVIMIGSILLVGVVLAGPRSGMTPPSYQEVIATTNNGQAWFTIPTNLTVTIKRVSIVFTNGVTGGFMISQHEGSGAWTRSIFQDSSMAANTNAYNTDCEGLILRGGRGDRIEVDATPCSENATVVIDGTKEVIIPTD